MKFCYRFCCLILWCGLLSSCQDHRDTSIDTFGELDSLQVAADTTMQVNLDRSYEYQKSLIGNDTTVYDFLAYDKPKGSSSPEWESKFIVVRRAKSAYDTIIKDVRSGIVQKIWLSDLDQNGKPEIMFYEYPKHDAQNADRFQFYAYHMNGRQKAGKISVSFKEDKRHYKGMDSFFVSGNYLIRKAPYYKQSIDSVPSGSVWQSYKLLNGNLVFEKEKIVE